LPSSNPVTDSVTWISKKFSIYKKKSSIIYS
jgi:hypothetical protein